METGLPMLLDRVVTLSLGVLLLALVAIPISRPSVRWIVIPSFLTVSILGGYLLNLLSGFRTVERLPGGGWGYGTRMIVFECLRFASWQAPMALVFGFLLSRSPDED